jgi:hypothetical protein
MDEREVTGHSLYSADWLRADICGHEAAPKTLRHEGFRDQAPQIIQITLVTREFRPLSLRPGDQDSSFGGSGLRPIQFLSGRQLKTGFLRRNSAALSSCFCTETSASRRDLPPAEKNLRVRIHAVISLGRD